MQGVLKSITIILFEMYQCILILTLLSSKTAALWNIYLKKINRDHDFYLAVCLNMYIHAFHACHTA